MIQQPIGIIDSGIGGFTVATAVQALLPCENILYLGDGANAPYGNRSASELSQLAQYMVQFMNQSQVKLLLVACNTISCLASTYESQIQCPVLYVVKSGAKAVAELDYQKIGVISTMFTHEQGLYRRYIQEISPEKQVFSVGSRNLVRLIEENQGDEASRQAIHQELQEVLPPLVAEGVGCCVLGCTHYPLAKEALTHCFPSLPFSDPAEEMARQTKALLSKYNLLNPSGGKLSVYTTGEPDLQPPHLLRAGLVAQEIRHLLPLDLGTEDVKIWRPRH